MGADDFGMQFDVRPHHVQYVRQPKPATEVIETNGCFSFRLLAIMAAHLRKNTHTTGKYFVPMDEAGN